MQNLSILIVGGGIGGLSAAIALCERGFSVHLIEREPTWSAYGVGIIQQGNVLRAIQSLGILGRYIDAGAGFDHVEVFTPAGVRVARVPSPRLLVDRPANLGIGRRALQAVLVEVAQELGAILSLGKTVDSIQERAQAQVQFSDGSSESFDLVIAADGAHSQLRETLFDGAPGPTFTGQGVWRYNLPRAAALDALQVYNGPIGAGLVPIGPDLMYLYLTTPEPDNPRYAESGLAATMRAKTEQCAPLIKALASGITDDSQVVYRPLESLLVEGAWNRGRVVLLGDAAHTSTPHLGQGAGLAIEDALVLAEELSRQSDLASALGAYHDRRLPRCRYIVESSLAICRGQLGKGRPIDNAKATAEMFAVVSQAI